MNSEKMAAAIAVALDFLTEVWNALVDLIRDVMRDMAAAIGAVVDAWKELGSILVNAGQRAVAYPSTRSLRRKDNRKL